MKSIQQNYNIKQSIEKPILPRTMSYDRKNQHKHICSAKFYELEPCYHLTFALGELRSKNIPEAQLKSLIKLHNEDSYNLSMNNGTHYFTSEAIKKYKVIAEMLPDNETVQAKFELIKELNEHDIKYIAPPKRAGSMDKAKQTEIEDTAWRRSEAFAEYANNIMDKIDEVDKMPLSKKLEALYKRPLEHWEFKNPEYADQSIEDTYEESITMAITTYKKYIGYEDYQKSFNIKQDFNKEEKKSYE